MDCPQSLVAIQNPILKPEFNPIRRSSNQKWYNTRVHGPVSTFQEPDTVSLLSEYSSKIYAF